MTTTPPGEGMDLLPQSSVLKLDSGAQINPRSDDSIVSSPSTQERRVSSSPEMKIQPSKIPQTSAPSLKSSVPTLQNHPPSDSVASPSVINKQLLSKLNKSLKEKQKIITQSVSHPKNPTLIQDVLSTSPKFSPAVNPGLALGNSSNEATSKGVDTLNEKPENNHIDSETIPSINSATLSKDSASNLKAKNKRIAKQNSTRTDFFAAKLASAVDDVESSDSDGTFVYETNAPDIDNDDTNNSETVGTEMAVSQNSNTPLEDQRSTENINNAPVSIQLVNDNISISGSYRGLGEHISTSPIIEQKKDDGIASSIPPTMSLQAAESVLSLQTSKHGLGRVSNGNPPFSNSSRTPQNLGLSFGGEGSQYFDPYLDNSSRYSRHPTRKNSEQSMFSEDHKDSFLRSPKSPYRETHHSGVSTPLGISEQSNNISEPYTNAMYCYREEDVSGDECSSHGDMPLMNGAPQLPVTNVENKVDGVSSSKPYTNKTSTTSSKLRSTTSKLFDRRGAQPRRYSTIPDDIDIEDFDDELIYYDNNNIRFPYNRSVNGGINESSSLLGDHKLPHYKSLNLSYGAKRTPVHLKSKRYLSMGYVPLQGFGPKKNDPFPFPYPQNGDSSYYGFRECEEEPTHNTPGNLRTEYHSDGVQPYPNNRHLLSAKASRDTLDRENFQLIKSVIYTFAWILGILIFGFVLGFIFASAKDLSNVTIVSIDNALVSLDELVFSVVVEALNPGWFTVTIDEIELDIFAKSGYLESPSPESSVETVLLGSVFNFESAINFEGSFLNRRPAQQVGEIKLVGPGKNLTGSANVVNVPGQTLPKTRLDPTEPADNAEKWKSISKHPFDLIMRGVLKYKLAINHSVKSVVVNKVGYVDPSNSN